MSASRTFCATIIAVLILGCGERTFGNLLFGTPSLVPNVNSSGSDASPSLSDAGGALFFSTTKAGGSGSTDLWMATRQNGSDDWQEPVNLGETVNSRAYEEGPDLSADGTMLFFADSLWWDPNVPHRNGTDGTGDIWMSIRETPDAKWTEPTNDGILTNVNSRWQEGDPSISKDGLSLFFDSNRAGSFDLYAAQRPTTSDPFGEPINLGATVNSSSIEVEPSISADGLTLFFMSDRPGTAYDIWVTTRPSLDALWGNPVNVGSAVNASGIEATPDISPDGSMLYFLSDRSGGPGATAIWQVPIIPLERVALNGNRDTYSQDFDQALGADGSATGILYPTGWTITTDCVVFENTISKRFPAGSAVRGTSNAGASQDSDRALAIGVDYRSRGGTFQLLADITESSAAALQLEFDLEAWDARRSSLDTPGEAAFDVILEVNRGDGFSPSADFAVTTGPTLMPPTGDYLDGNAETNRASFDSGVLGTDLPLGSQLRVRWTTNTDGQTRGWLFGLDNVELSVWSVLQTGDFDGDGVLDVEDIGLLMAEIISGVPREKFDLNGDESVTQQDLHVWVSDLKNTWIGDANLDLEFNSSDMVQVFATGKYETKQQAGWAEGDWNADGIFDSSDMVAAFADGGYEQGPRAAAAAVPEPTSVLLLMTGLIGVAVCRRPPPRTNI